MSKNWNPNTSGRRPESPQPPNIARGDATDNATVSDPSPIDISKHLEGLNIEAQAAEERSREGFKKEEHIPPSPVSKNPNSSPHLQCQRISARNRTVADHPSIDIVILRERLDAGNQAEQLAEGNEPGDIANDRGSNEADEAGEIKKLTAYWDSISDDRKQKFLTMEVANLMAHFSSIKNKPALHFLREAISFEAANSKSYCRSATHFEATINENLRVFFPKLKEVLLDNTVMPGFFIKWSAKELCLTSRILGSHKDFGSSKEKFLMTHENERNVFIVAIHGMLVTLVSRKCLSYALIEDMILYATDFVQESLYVESNKMLPSCQFEFFSILLSNLGAPQLEKIYNQLQAISHSCFGGKNVVGQESEDHDVKLSLQIPESMSLLGSYFLKFNSSHKGYLPDADTLLCWINSGHWDDDQLSDWNNQHERKKTHRSNGILRAMDAKFNSLVSMFEAKLVLLSREKILVESEKHTRENSMEKPLRRHRVAVLKEEEADNSIVQLAGIVNLFTGSNLSDSSSAKLILQELGRSIKAVISDGYERLVMKLNLIDAKITQNLNEMVDLELELGAASASEYHKLLIPLIKSYMLSRLDFLPEYHVQEEPVAPE